MPDRESPYAPRLARALAASAGLLALGSLAAWLIGCGAWLALGDQFIPIAPTTALLLLLVSVAVWWRAGIAPEHEEPSGVVGLAAVAIAGSLAAVYLRTRGVTLRAEDWLAGSPVGLSDSADGRISVYGASLVALTSATLVLRRLGPTGARAEGVFASASIGLSVLVLHGYVLVGPLLFDGSAIRVSIVCAGVLLLLGAAQVSLTAAESWPLRLFVRESTAPEQSSRVRFSVVAVLVGGFILASGLFWYLAERQRSTDRTMAAHDEMATLTASELERWYQTELSAARAISTAPLDVAALRATSASGAGSINAWLERLHQVEGFDVVALFDERGQLAITAPARARDEVRGWNARLRAFPTTGTEPVVEYVTTTSDLLVVWTPVQARAGTRVERQWLALATELEQSLGPILARMPSLGHASEAQLWRRAGDTAIALTGLVDERGVRAPVRVVLDSSSALPVGQAVRGATGVIDAVNRHGASVRAVVRRVDAPGWWLVHSIPDEELVGPVRRFALRATLSSLLLVLALTAALFALWSRRDLAAATRELRHIRERDQSRLRLSQLDRMLKMRSAVALALVRSRSEQELLDAACAAAVDVGGYRMAWIGMARHDEIQRVEPVAVAGAELGYLALGPLSWSATHPRGAGPTGRAIRSGTIQTAQDLASDRHYAPWRVAARERGYAAACAIPLEVRGEVVGTFSLYDAEAFAFDQEELTLLASIGSDIAFGIGALRDQSAVQRQQSQLALFREVIDRSSDAVYLTDASTVRFIDFNESAVSALGYSADELRELGPVDVVEDIRDAEDFERRTAEVARGETHTRRTTHRRKDGSTFPVEISLAVIAIGDRRLVLSIARDVSDRLESEQEREQLQSQFLRAQKMESVGRLAGGVAHDFNNLLTVINGTADLALADLPGNAPLRGDLTEIRAAGERAASLTRQLLAFSRQQVLHPRRLDLNDVVDGFLGLLRRVIGEDIAVDVIRATQPAPVVADAGQLEQVLMNLCVNARDAMPHGGRLEIGVAIVDLDAVAAALNPTMRAGRYVLLTISDTGEGMSTELQARIFEPFFTTKEPGRGTGLGLSTVYGIVKQSGGHIWVDSAIGEGTTFRIYLPLATGGREHAVSPPRPKLSTGTETVLVVEDEEAIRFVVRRVLEKSGYTVIEASDGASALAAIAAHDGPLDLVMTDLVMPGMSGIELARLLRQSRPNLPIVLASGYSQETVSNEFDVANEWHLISKPYAVQDLLLEIRKVLDAAQRSS